MTSDISRAVNLFAAVEDPSLDDDDRDRIVEQVDRIMTTARPEDAGDAANVLRHLANIAEGVRLTPEQIGALRRVADMIEDDLFAPGEPEPVYLEA